MKRIYKVKPIFLIFLMGILLLALSLLAVACDRQISSMGRTEGSTAVGAAAGTGAAGQDGGGITVPSGTDKNAGIKTEDGGPAVPESGETTGDVPFSSVQRGKTGTGASDEKNDAGEKGQKTDTGETGKKTGMDNAGEKTGTVGPDGEKNPDGKPAYSTRELELVKEAGKLYSEGDLEGADRLYGELSTMGQAWRNDPVLLLNWGMALSSLGSFKEALAKTGDALEKAQDRQDIDKEVIDDLTVDALTALTDKVPDARTLQGDELRQVFKILDENERAFDSIQEGKEKLANAYIKLASAFLKSMDALVYAEDIKDCLDKAGRNPEAGSSPFFLYIKGLMEQHGSNMEEAVRFMRSAQKIARNNRDIELWLMAYDPEIKKQAGVLKEITLEDLGLEGDGFDVYAGTKWLDNGKILAAVNRGEGESGTRRLIALDTATLAWKEVYEGSWFELKSITPDGNFALLYDSGIKLVDLKAGKIRSIPADSSLFSLSPDGRKIAYTYQGLWIYDIQKGTQKRIHKGTTDISPIWFLDGQSILFAGGLGTGDGSDANALQGIFRIPVNHPQEKTRVVPEWESSFGFLDWIIPGELVYVLEGWEDGNDSYILDIYSGDKKFTGSVHNGDTLVYRPGNSDVYSIDGRGYVTRMDESGRMSARYEFGDIWGDSFGVVLSHMQVMCGSGNVMFLYGPTFGKNKTLWMADRDLGHPSLLAEVPGGFDGPFILSPEENKILFSSGKDRISIYTLESQDGPG